MPQVHCSLDDTTDVLTIESVIGRVLLIDTPRADKHGHRGWEPTTPSLVLGIVFDDRIRSVCYNR